MRRNSFARCIARLLAGLCGMAVGIAAAQSDWPKAKPVSILVGFAPGSTTDLVARVIAQKLGETSGASFVVENKPGAGGNIASGLVKRRRRLAATHVPHS